MPWTTTVFPASAGEPQRHFADASIERKTPCAVTGDGSPDLGVVIAVDASYSMGHGGLAESRHEDAIKRVREVLDTVALEDPVTLVQMSDRPTIHFRGSGYNPEKFDEVISTLEPSALGLSLEKNIEQLEELVAELKAPSKECYLITDAQEDDWNELSQASRETLSRLTDEADVYIVPTRKSREDNISIRRLVYASGTLTEQGMARFTAEVRNEGRSRTTGGDATLYLDDRKVSRRALGPLDPGQTRSLSFYAPFTSAGDVSLTAKLSGQDDGLKIDNVRQAVVNVQPAIQVLCVDNVPEINEDTKYEGSFFLSRVFRLKGGSNERIQMTRSYWQDMPRSGLSDFDVIIMANVPEVDLDLAKRLKRFVEGGGGLMFFLGEDVDTESYNKRLAGEAVDLLPAKLLESVRIPEQSKPWGISASRSMHPLATLVQRLPEEVTATAKVAKVVKAQPSAEAETILDIPELDAPLLIRRDVGLGSVLLFTTTADRAWSNLPVHPIYVMLMRQAVTNITSRPDSRTLLTGQTKVIPVPGRKIGQTIEISGPDDSVVKVQVSQTDGEPVIAFAPDRAGLYEIPATDNVPAVTLAANVDPRESNVRVIDPGAIRSSLQSTQVKVVEGASDFAAMITEGRQGREIGALLLYLGIIVFILQSLLAKHYSERMTSEDKDLSGSFLMERIRSARRS